jgi:hypothetical protein
MGLLVDNPIIVKHLRSRLRPAQAVPGAIALVCVAAVLTWLAFATDAAGGFIGGSIVFSLLWCLLALVLVVLGSEQVATAVSVARETGILDFHRISPLPPVVVALGFFLGAPIRETGYALLLIPFLIATAVLAEMPWATFLDLLATVVLIAWLVHASQLLSALASRRPRASGRGILLLVFITLGAVASATRNGGALADIAAPPFFGVPLPRVVFLGIHSLAATLFLLVAATRRMRDQRAAFLSKGQALACLATVATLAVGCLWTAEPTPALVALLATLVTTGVVCGMPIAVTAGEYLKGVRRARRVGWDVPQPLDDAATSGVCVIGLCLVAAVAGLVLQRRLAADWQAWAWAGAIGLAVIATHGFARQYYRLRSGQRGDLQCNLALFLLWVLPLPVAAAWSASGLDKTVGTFLWEATPWAGMTQAVTAADNPVGRPGEALVVTGGSALVFGILAVRQAAIARRETEAPGPA